MLLKSSPGMSICTLRCYTNLSYTTNDKNNNMYMILKSLPIKLLFGCVNNESNLMFIRDLVMVCSHIEYLYKA